MKEALVIWTNNQSLLNIFVNIHLRGDMGEMKPIGLILSVGLGAFGPAKPYYTAHAVWVGGDQVPLKLA